MYFAWKLGAADYSRLVIEGEDEVGVRYLRTDKLGLEVAVFYPVTGGEGFRQKMQYSLNRMVVEPLIKLALQIMEQLTRYFQPL